jgi:hypothetical protein
LSSIIVLDTWGYDDFYPEFLVDLERLLVEFDMSL